MTNEEEEIFLKAREVTGRSAFQRWLKSQGELTDEGLKTAAQTFARLPLLLDPKLLDISLWALGQARGRQIVESEPFPAMLWLGGAMNTEGGRTFSGNIGQFVKLLQDRARALAPKRTGWVIEPVTNSTGHRTNAATMAMHALFLDADGTGEWDNLLAVLNHLNFAYVAYQSGGWAPTTPKWRIVLPLSAPHDTRTVSGQSSWKTIYNHARVAFGACARLSSVGFDPATETPCCPWFLTERRDAADTERKIIFRVGHSLDLTALAIALPEVVEQKPEFFVRGPVTEISLDEKRMNEIIDALTAATNRVPTGRRDLYLALPGALLDRGVASDDVLAIIEAVSASYPRSHPEKHADNLHNARTTVAKWEAKENYTRIGTLNAIAPQVASALDLILPDPMTKAFADSIEQMLAPTPVVAGAPTSAPAPVTNTNATLGLRRRGKLSNTGRQVSPIATRLRSSRKPLNKLAGLLLSCLVDGVPLPTTEHTTDAEVDEMVAICMRTLGRALPVQTRWQEVLDFSSASLSLMGFTQSKERVAVAERAFYEGQGKRQKALAVKTQKHSEFVAGSQSFFAAVRKGR